MKDDFSDILQSREDIPPRNTNVSDCTRAIPIVDDGFLSHGFEGGLVTNCSKPTWRAEAVSSVI